jgi:energy-coupling factor transporter ATP-binding protein EcfA2
MPPAKPQTNPKLMSRAQYQKSLANDSLTDWELPERSESGLSAARQVPVKSRKQFLKEFSKGYQAGQHVTFLGPSGRGKTSLMGDMLGAVLNIKRDIKIEARILHGKIKGRDLTILRIAKNLKLAVIEEGMPTSVQRWKMKLKGQKGFVVRPLTKAMENVDAENRWLHRHFGKTIHKSYHASKKHPVILVVDEAHQTHNDLGLRKECEGPLMRGRPVCGEWSLIQRGRHVSYMAYDQAEHVIIFFDPDRSNQERYSEIGGVDPKVLIELSRRLKTKTVKDGSTISQALYFRRSGEELAIIDMD